MAIVNRSLDSSEQVKTFPAALNLVATGLAIPIFTAPYPCTVQGIIVQGVGLSGSPTGLVKTIRNTSGGATTITGGWTTLTLQAAGTSGPQSVVQAAAGSSFLSLAQGDTLTYTSGGSNTAAFVHVSVVVKCLQDIRDDFGL